MFTMLRRTVALGALVALSHFAPPASSMTPWLLPQSFSNGTKAISIAQNFTLECLGSCAILCETEIVKQAFARYQELVRPAKVKAGEIPRINTISVCIASDDLTLGPGTNESYALHVGLGDAISEPNVRAETVYGMLHALESFSQLVDTAAGFIITNAPITIADYPRFPYRGLLIDTGRHFLPVEKIRQAIDGLHANKLNVLHWHIVDTPSFPCGSDKYPQLAEKGAFSPHAIYSTQDMRDLVLYAKLRGVRIMPEWDIPGHGSWGMGMPSIMGCDIVLDPTQDAVYDFLNDFFAEMMTIFDDEYVFLGGDEVTATCWDKNANISKWLKENGMTSSELQQYFWQQVTKRVLPKSLKGRTVSIWKMMRSRLIPLHFLAALSLTCTNQRVPLIKRLANSICLQC